MVCRRDFAAHIIIYIIPILASHQSYGYRLIAIIAIVQPLKRKISHNTQSIITSTYWPTYPYYNKVNSSYECFRVYRWHSVHSTHRADSVGIIYYGPFVCRAVRHPHHHPRLRNVFGVFNNRCDVHRALTCIANAVSAP